MEIVEDRTRVTLEAVIINRIRAGSVIHSDCWASYNHISTIANKNFTHGTVNHSNKDFPFKDPITWGTYKSDRGLLVKTQKTS